MGIPSRVVHTLAVGAALAAALSLASCKGQGKEGSAGPSGKKLSFRILTNNASSFWTAMEKGMDVGAKEVGCEARRLTPPGSQPTNGDQRAVFDQAVVSGIDGIAVSPIEAKAFAPVIDSAIAKGVPVITFDSDADMSKRLAYIGTNNYEAGKKAGEEAVRLLPNGGKYVAFVGSMSAENARERYRGFTDAIKGHNIEPLQDPFEDRADKTGAAYRNVADAITKYGDRINLFLGIWSYNGPAITAEIQKAGIRNKVKLVCFDGDPQTLAALKAGQIDATVVQKPYEFGRLSVKLLYLIKKDGVNKALTELKPDLDKLGMKVDGVKIDTGVEVITPSNAGPFLDKLHKLGLETT